jgi:hypothetical protein
MWPIHDVDPYPVTNGNNSGSELPGLFHNQFCGIRSPDVAALVSQPMSPKDMAHAAMKNYGKEIALTVRDSRRAAHTALPVFEFDDLRVTTVRTLERAKVVVWLVGRLNAGKHGESPTPGTVRTIESDLIDLVWLSRMHDQPHLPSGASERLESQHWLAR